MDNSNQNGDLIQIPLSKNRWAFVDPIDADLIEFKWYTWENPKYEQRYAARNLRVDETKRKTQFMHRVILERILDRPLSRNENVDHINGNQLDNRRSNLRLANHAENARNRGASRRNKSGYKGVHFSHGKWEANIVHEYKTIYLGIFDTPEEAHEAYKRKAAELDEKFFRFE